MSKNSKAVINWRKRTKIKLVEGFGGKCHVCGYNKCMQALEFHHLDPSKKEFSFGQFQSKAWVKLVAEIKKCALLCAICHRELHAGIIQNNDIQIIQFDENLIKIPKFIRNKNLLFKKPKLQIECKNCGALHTNKKYCSDKCYRIGSEKINWIQYDLKEMSKTMNFLEISRKLGVSDNAIRKRMKKLHLL